MKYMKDKMNQKTMKTQPICRYSGLSNEEVDVRVKSGLVNGNFDIKTKSIKQIFTTNIFTLFNMVNIFLGTCVFIVHSYKNMMFLFVVLSNLVIGITQEIRAKKTIDKMSLLSSKKVLAMRNGEEVQIDHQEIVKDDILLFKSGNQVSVDCVVVSGSCEMDESLLTGESDTVFKQCGDKLLSGSYVVSGSVVSKAENVGLESYVNKISQQVKYIKKNESEMLNSIKRIIKVVSIGIFPLAVMIFYRQFFVVKQPFDTVILSMVASVLGMIPSGLVLLISVVLAVSVLRLAKKDALVQDMFCVETLARVDVLCLDKTGTLTEGKLKVEKILYIGEENTVNKEIAEFMGAIPDENATALAIREKFGIDNTFSIEEITPFSSATKYSSVKFKEFGTYKLGAPEMILENSCDNYQEKIHAFLNEGKRVLAFVSSNESGNQKVRCFIVMSDIVRENAKDTLSYFEKEEVEIKIISGDNPITVVNVAKEAGVKNYNRYIDVSTLKSEEEVKKAAGEYTVFGRVTPKQKLLIIQELKNQNHIVGMTGDGVNDVMALKESDCSIAMQSGSDAARNISKIVLLNSDFAVLPEILREGRRSINNLERSASLYLVKTIYSFVLALVFSVANFVYPFTPIQLTVIGACSIGIPSFILALEKNTQRVKGRFIHNVLKKSIPGALLIILNIMTAQSIGIIFNATKGQTSTLSTYMTAAASMVILFMVCIPFSKVRLVMYCILTTLLFGTFSLFENILSINKIDLLSIIIIAVMVGVSLVVYQLLSYCVERIMGYFVKSNRKIN